MITLETLRGKGYPISALKNQEQVELAEKTIILSYFPKYTDFESEFMQDVLSALVFALILRRSTMATRFGTVQKIDGYSQTVEDAKSLKEARSYALPFYDTWLKENDFDFTDVIGLYDRILL